MSAEGEGGTDPVPYDSFRLSSYLLDLEPHIVTAFLSFAAVGAFLSATGTPLSNLAIPGVATLLAGTAMLAFGFLRRRAYYRELAQALEGLEKSWHLPSMVDEPEFLDGRLSWELALALSMRAASEVAEAEEGVQAYRDYVEAWIHEIKTPIAAAMLVLDRMHGPDTRTLKLELEKIAAHAEQALYFARSSNLNADYAIAEASLAEVCRGVCRANAHFLIERGVMPSIEIDDELTVLADSSWLAFVVTQATVNAAKYGATTVVFSAIASAEGADGATILSIRDDGPGIGPADLPRVTERGYIGENGRAAQSATGMGLYLSKTMCDRMGLGFAIRSEPDQGTSVDIVFPHDRRRLALV